MVRLYFTPTIAPSTLIHEARQQIFSLVGVDKFVMILLFHHPEDRPEHVFSANRVISPLSHIFKGDEEAKAIRRGAVRPHSP